MKILIVNVPLAPVKGAHIIIWLAPPCENPGSATDCEHPIPMGTIVHGGGDDLGSSLLASLLSVKLSVSSLKRATVKREDPL